MVIPVRPEVYYTAILVYLRYLSPGSTENVSYRQLKSHDNLRKKIHLREGFGRKTSLKFFANKQQTQCSFKLENCLVPKVWSIWQNLGI